MDTKNSNVFRRNNKALALLHLSGGLSLFLALWVPDQSGVTPGLAELILCLAGFLFLGLSWYLGHHLIFQDGFYSVWPFGDQAHPLRPRGRFWFRVIYAVFLAFCLWMCLRLVLFGFYAGIAVFLLQLALFLWTDRLFSTPASPP